MTNKFDYHLEKAIQSLLDDNKSQFGDNKDAARSFVRKNVWTLINFRLAKIVEKLIP